MKPRIVSIFMILSVLLASCGAPLFMSEDRRFQSEPELIQQLQPYLPMWATNPAEATEDERRSIGARLGVGLAILNWNQLDSDQNVVVVQISIEALGDWSRGYLYVHDGAEIETQVAGWELRRVDEHFYLYNYVD